ncbi:MAG: NAD(P)-binding protein [Lachnospiraceae bacterium]|nr:NAD(P)-binding protein [Lachnospiraceae bacterium]
MKYLILGAGPAGLTFANQLKQLGETSFLVVEKEKNAGGLCRSTIVDEKPFDIGGGHFLDALASEEVKEFLFQFMPQEEWNLFERDSRIDINGSMISHPIEANIWQMEIEQQVEYLKSIALAGCNTSLKMPEKFVDWIYWKLGDKIAAEYMIPYNEKMFGAELNLLGTYWLDKLPNVSFEETLKSCLRKKPYGKQPGHARFYYPVQYGYGELWRRMAERIKDNLICGSTVQTIDFNMNRIILSDGKKFTAEKIITTIPWREFVELTGMPENLREMLNELKHTSVYTTYVQKNLNTSAHWIYYPEKSLSYHRILVRHNFCPGSRGYWTETNEDRFIKKTVGEESFYNKYAYPLNTIQKPVIMKKLLLWAKTKNVYGLGRWGEHQHYNSDITVKKALELCVKLYEEK